MEIQSMYSRVDGKIRLIFKKSPQTGWISLALEMPVSLNWLKKEVSSDELSCV